MLFAAEHDLPTRRSSGSLDAREPGLLTRVMYVSAVEAGEEVVVV